MDTLAYRFMNFLQEEFQIPTNDLTFAWQRSEEIVDSLPMVLWQYGFVNLMQLDQSLDWLQETQSTSETQMLFSSIGL
jgi:hypothetical protein